MSYEYNNIQTHTKEGQKTKGLFANYFQKQYMFSRTKNKETRLQLKNKKQFFIFKIKNRFSILKNKKQSIFK